MNGTIIGSAERMRWLPRFWPLSNRNIVVLLGMVGVGKPRDPRPVGSS
jgi:hypothetical protein